LVGGGTPSWDHRLPQAPDNVFLVAGGNAGIGYFISGQLAGTGATIVIADATRRRPGSR
jgi:NAD(P)-dependent dehydrogenase (short-subunit alcohol dehydrogenase family)